MTYHRKQKRICRLYGGMGRALVLPVLLFGGLFYSCAKEDAVVVCVLDSGCSLDEVCGWNYLDDTDDLIDQTGHGTVIVSLICAGAPDADVVMQKCFDRERQTDEEAMIAALYAAVDEYGADVINMSWATTEESGELHEAVRHAYEAGAVLVSPTGNLDFVTGFDAVVYPAAWDEVIGVGAVNVDQNGVPSASLWYLTGEAVFVCADGKAGEERGTSYASARIAGTTAALLAKNRDADQEKIRELLRNMAEDLGDPGYDTKFGWGYIAVKNADLS